MKKVLIVAYYFPPVSASGSMRPLAMCKYLRAYGWESRVLTTDPESVGPSQGFDERLLAEVPDGATIMRIPHRDPLRALLRGRERLRSMVLERLCRGGAREWRRRNGSETTQGPSSSQPRMRDLILDWMFGFPDPQRWWLRPALRSISGLPAAESPRVILATGGPWTSLLVGRELGRIFKVPFVCDFRDPWSANEYARFSWSILQHSAEQLERAVIREAARVIVNTDELGERLRAAHPDMKEKFVTITNGFYRRNDMRRRGDPEHVRSSEDERVELSHFGSVYGKRDPCVLLQSVKELLRDRVINGTQLRIRFVGSWDLKEPRCEKLAAELEREGVLRREPRIPHDVCLQQMSKAGVLLAIQPDSPLQIPAKIFEYLASGRPLLVIGGEGATANLVRKHRLGLCCENDISKIKSLLTSLIRHESLLAAPASESLTQFDYEKLTGNVAAVLEAVCGRTIRKPA